MPDKMVTIPETEYLELKRKAAIADKYSKKNSASAKSAMAKLTPEERSVRAKKAVEARIKKYGQKRSNASK